MHELESRESRPIGVKVLHTVPLSAASRERIKQLLETGVLATAFNARVHRESDF